MATHIRTRLAVDARRDQLVEAAARLFADRRYDDVRMEEVATAADVSRALVYHYFPTKQELFAAVVRGQAERMAALTEPDPELPPLERLRAGVDAYLDYVEGNEHGYRAVHRGAGAADEDVRATLDTSHERHLDRLLRGIAGDAQPSAALRLGVRAWLGFVTTACLEWLDRGQPDRQTLRELLVHSLLGVITAAAQANSSASRP